MSSFLRRYCLTIGWSVVVLLLSVVKFSLSGGVATVPYGDKWMHALMYCVFTFALSYEYHPRLFKNYFVVWIIASLYGGGLEIIQTFIPYRSGDWLDALANSAGALLGVLIILCITLWKRQKPSNK